MSAGGVKFSRCMLVAEINASKLKGPPLKVALAELFSNSAGTSWMGNTRLLAQRLIRILSRIWSHMLHLFPQD